MQFSPEEGAVVLVAEAAALVPVATPEVVRDAAAVVDAGLTPVAVDVPAGTEVADEAAVAADSAAKKEEREVGAGPVWTFPCQSCWATALPATARTAVMDWTDRIMATGVLRCLDRFVAS